MPLVKYTDGEGFAYLVRVPAGVPERDYKLGIRLGPPDLSGVGLPKEQEIRLRNALVEAQMVNAETIRGSASKLFQVVHNTFPKSDARAIVRLIKSVYQHDYYAEIPEDIL